jgi:hypothetical protein
VFGLLFRLRHRLLVLGVFSLGLGAASVVLAAAATAGAAGAAAVVLPVCANTGKARAVSREATMTDLVFMAISF